MMRHGSDEPDDPDGPACHLSLLVPQEAEPAPGVRERLAAQRPPIALRLAGHGAELSIGATMSGTGAPAVLLPVLLGRSQASIELPAALPEPISDILGLPVGWGGEAPAQRALLLEAALLDAVRDLEALLERPLRFGEGEAHALPVSLGLRLVVGEAKLALRLGLDEELAGELADRLDRTHPPQAPDHSGLPCVIRVEAGWQELTSHEIWSLRPGDIVVLDEAMPRAVAGDRLAAPVSREERGFVLGAPFVPLAGRARVNTEPASLVTFEFARLATTLGEVAALCAGGPLPIAASGSGHLDIVVSGTRIGRGELVALGAGQGVRILSLSGGGAQENSRDPAGA